MARQNWKGSVLLAPVPAVMVSCGDMENSNIITASWTGVLCTHPPKTYVSVRPSRYSYDIIKKGGVFAINLTTRELARAADWCGVHTGAKVDKFERCRLTKERASEIDCPILAESPLVLECRVTDVIPLGSHDMFLADIVAVDVDEAVIDESGKLHLERANLVAYSHGEYFELGKRIGKFGYAVAKKKKPQGKKKS